MAVILESRIANVLLLQRLQTLLRPLVLLESPQQLLETVNGMMGLEKILNVWGRKRLFWCGEVVRIGMRGCQDYRRLVQVLLELQDCGVICDGGVGEDYSGLSPLWISELEIKSF